MNLHHWLLRSDVGITDEGLAEMLHVRPLTVARTREQWVKERRLEDKPSAKRKPRLDGKQEAVLVALACSQAPAGRDEWTMQLLADKIVALGVIDRPISDETVAKSAMVYSQGGRGLCVADGSCLGTLWRSLPTLAGDGLL